MKKLLGILGTITIAGSVMPTIVAVSPAPTQEQKTKLNRIKRNSNEKIFYLNNDNRDQYRIGVSSQAYFILCREAAEL